MDGFGRRVLKKQPISYGKGIAYITHQTSQLGAFGRGIMHHAAPRNDAPQPPRRGFVARTISRPSPIASNTQKHGDAAWLMTTPHISLSLRRRGGHANTTCKTDIRIGVDISKLCVCVPSLFSLLCIFAVERRKEGTQVGRDRCCCGEEPSVSGGRAAVEYHEVPGGTDRRTEEMGRIRTCQTAQT